jgi:hypothetical protein
MNTDQPEWRSESEMLEDPRVWQPTSGPPAPALPPPRLARGVEELRRTSHAPARLADPWQLLYFQVRAGR